MRSLISLCIVLLTIPAVSQDLPFPNARPLTMEGDITSQLVDGVDRFLLRQIERAEKERGKLWQLDYSSLDAYNASAAPHRKRLREIIGATGDRVKNPTLQIIAEPGESGLVASTEKFRVFAVRWPVLPDPDPKRSQPSTWGEGLLLVPKNEPRANIIAIPDADQTPEQIVGLEPGLPPRQQVARRFADNGFQVLVPALVSRTMTQRNGRSVLSNREYIYRSAFLLGRHLIGYEVQSVLAGADYFQNDARPLGVIGYGEGGLLALMAGAVDLRIDAVATLGYVGPRDQFWQEPLSRNVFGLFREFGPFELLSLVNPRPVLMDGQDSPAVSLSGKNGGGPAALQAPDAIELMLLSKAFARLTVDKKPGFRTMPRILGPGGNRVDSVKDFAGMLLPGESLQAAASKPNTIDSSNNVAKQRENRLIEQFDRHNQLLLRESPFVRREFMKNIDTSSVDAFEKSTVAYRETFSKDVIGRFDLPLLKPNPRLRKTWEHEKWIGYEVVLDVFDDVIAYGALLVPRDLKPAEKRPVVVCQHGLEGRPTDTFLNDHYAYHDFAGKLVERGFITFAPQNLYIFRDRFRTLQRKANGLGKTLFSIIIPQHQQIVNWLKTVPGVDSDRIAFYGLSYGGKSAMRIPAVVTDYCLSICSADFNEWVRKNASTRHNFSYVWTGEYEIFEWNLGSTFNYAEMATLIAPRPFMVERGHFDGVGVDEWVAYEYAKVRHLYAAKLGIPDRTEIEWFKGPHTINGKGTFDFLHRHLNWPVPSAASTK